MVDVEDRIREMLRRRAGDVSPPAEAPRGMLRRAWRRIILTFTGGAVAVAVVATGAAAGLRAIDRSDQGGVAASSAPARCAVGSLRASVDLQGEAGNLVASIVVTNKGTTACSLSGRPGVEILDGTGLALDVVPMGGDPWWRVQRLQRPSGWPVVSLPAGGSARARVVWSNWCGTVSPATWRIELPEGGVLRIANGGHTPQCGAPASRSTLEVGPFEPRS